MKTACLAHSDLPLSGIVSKHGSRLQTTEDGFGTVNSEISSPQWVIMVRRPEAGRSQASARCKLCWPCGPHSTSTAAGDYVTQGEVGQVAYRQSVLSQIRLCADRIEELEALQLSNSSDDAEPCCLTCLPFLN